ncbi:MAG: hypothetical protein VKN60_01635, partial [Cyanobacteriota bacterium]|nr:hypothetical protein [Cyanobacteriota bacterium]
MKVLLPLPIFSRKFPWFWGLLLGFCLTLGWSAVSPLQAQPPLSQAQALYQAGDFQGALPLWRGVAERFAEEKDVLNQGMALSNLALTYQQLGDWQAATQAIEESRRVLAAQAPSPEQERLLRQALTIQGQLRLRQGAPQAALAAWQSAETLGKPDLETRLDLQRQQAEAYQALGMYPRACNALLTALGLPPKDCQISAPQLESLTEPEQAPILLALGATQRQMGRLESAWDVLLAADRLSENPAQKAEIRLNQGNVLKALANRQLTPAERQTSRLPAADRACSAPLSSGLGTFSLYRQALTCYQEAETLAPGLSGQHQARFNRGQLLAQLRQWPSLPPLLTALEQDVQQLLPGRAATTSRLKLTQTLLCLEQGFNPQALLSQSPLLQSCPLPSAEERRQYQAAFTPLLNPERSRRLLDQAKAEAEALGDPALLSNFWGYEGAWLAQQGQGKAALAATERAVAPITAYQNPELSYLWQWQLGRFAGAQGQTDRA